ncbi:hypothetical protein SG0764 [Sodalis glossinidius str. 'morsitans']|uniref:Acyltransferase 3 domain-containing protein n=1 Tax=Sodalis glossinidius (strain morsitans) TaxID=343509 RepID=Q2NUY6_SODGM|nr:hypothetical protein SG0764 [Sodalis glossinidius str. 'morsitans']
MILNIYRIITPGIPEFNYGPFGVAIFFIISGFVVSFSLKSKERIPFIKARLIRIYPTYIASMFIMIIVLYSTSIFFWSNKPSLTISDIISNVALINNLVGIKSIDAVNWTLAIEIKLYLLYTTFRSIIIKNASPFILGFGLCSICFSYLVSANENHSAITAFISDVIFINYINIGLCFYLAYSNIKGTTETIFLGVFSMASFIVSHHMIYSPPLHKLISFNYTYAIILFFIAYINLDHFKDIKIISYLAKISFPFYALHSVIGYITLRILEKEGVRYSSSLVITFLVIIILSHFINKIIDSRFTKKIARKI